MYGQFLLEDCHYSLLGRCFFIVHNILDYMYQSMHW